MTDNHRKFSVIGLRPVPVRAYPPCCAYIRRASGPSGRRSPVISNETAIGTADGMTWAASNRFRYLGAPLVAPDSLADAEKSVFGMVAQVQGGIPPRREPH